MSEKALEGVRVLELCEMVAGPYCGRLLADMGADVVKVERPGVGDPARRYGPFPDDVPHPEKSGLFLYANLNKRGVTLDVETPTGRRLLADLVRRADVVLEDRPPSEAQRLGLDYATLSAVNDQIIVTSVTPFGQTGPYANFKAYPLNTFHAGGEGYFLPGGAEWLSRPPVHGGGAFLGDYDSGLAAGVATVAALYDRAVSGRGQRVDISRQEVLMSLNGLDLTKWQNAGKVETRADRGPRLGSTLRCKDGYVEINVNFNHHWAALVRALGSPAWATDERYAYYKGRLDNDKELRASFETWSMSQTKRAVMETLQAHGCPAGAVNDPADVLASPQMQARGYFTEVSHPDAGRYKYASAPWKLSATPARYERAAPLHGEHNADIFCRELGLPPAELADLRRAGVI